MQVRDARPHGGGIEAVQDLGITGERDTQAKLLEPLRGQRPLIFRNDAEADRGRDYPNLITRPEFRGHHCRRILVRGLQDLKNFILLIAVLTGDGFQILLRHTHLA